MKACPFAMALVPWEGALCNLSLSPRAGSKQFQEKALSWEMLSVSDPTEHRDPAPAAPPRICVSYSHREAGPEALEPQTSLGNSKRCTRAPWCLPGSSAGHRSQDTDHQLFVLLVIHNQE